MMTFNVEEYWHGSGNTIYDVVRGANAGQLGDEQARQWFASLRSSVFDNIATMRHIIEEHDPDVICFTEHSLGINKDLLDKYKLTRFVDEQCWFTEKDIMSSLLPEGYSFFSKGTSECPAKFSELANAVAWKGASFLEVGDSDRVGELITPIGKAAPGGGKGHFTPRSVACVELHPIGATNPVIFCAAHLMGGRFEDSIWEQDCAAGNNERVNQVVAINDLLTSEAFTYGAAVVIAGDFNVMHLGFTEGPYVDGAKKYLWGQGKSYSEQEFDQVYSERYVPYQIASHEKLEELGYRKAYGRPDSSEEMKTSAYTGCTDWIYIKGISSKLDESVIPALKGESGRYASDHNPVVVTLVTSF